MRNFPCIVFLVALAACADANAPASVTKEPVRAKAGVLDLRRMGPDKITRIELRGEWKLYWNRFVTAKDLRGKSAPQPDALFNLPNEWPGHPLANGRKTTPHGFATFHLKILLPPDAAPIRRAVFIDYVYSSHRLYIGDELLLQGGHPGRDAAETRTLLRPTFAGFQAKQPTLDVFLHVANYAHMRGGPRRAPVFGTGAEITEYVMSRRRTDYLLIGAIAIIGLYNLALFLLRTSERAPLWFGLFCVVFALFTMTINGLIEEAVPDTNRGDDLIRLNYLTVYGSILLFTLYFASFFREFISTKIARFFIAAFSLTVFIVLALPNEIYSRTLLVEYALLGAASIWFIYTLFRRTFFGKDLNGAVGLAGYLIFAGSITMDILADLHIISSEPVSPYGIFGFIFAHALVIARSNARARETAEVLTDQLTEKNLALAGLDRLKDEFLANTSHELRTPLNGIIGLADSLIDGAAGKLPEEAETNLSMISSAGRRLASLIGDILDFSRLKNNDLKLIRGAVDMHSVAGIVMNISRPLLADKPVVMKNDIQPGELLVHGDENRLQQIMYNLIGNAVKFTKRGEIRVGARRNGNIVEVTVKDTGAGIAPERIKEIFLPFKQADASDTRDYQGAGLGLSITRKLVELHDGEITVQSLLGKGSSFVFTLPAYQGKVVSGGGASAGTTTRFLSNPDVPGTPARTMNTAETEEGTPRILIVDADAGNLKVLANHLTGRNHCVEWALSGSEALTMLDQEGDFDLVLLDVMMPGISGYEVCRRIRETHSSAVLPVILLTAKTQVRDIAEGFDAGANDYLIKPFSKQEFFARIDFHLNLKKSADELMFLKNSLEMQVFNRTRELNSALENLKDRDRVLQFELDVASRIQRGILPALPLQRGPLNVTAFYESMGKVGGDFFDALPMEGDRLGLLMADASGHGVPAALLTTMVKICFADAARRYSSSRDIIRYLNASMGRTITTQEYLTGMCAVIDADLNVSVTNAGHRYALHLRNGVVEPRGEPGMILGVFDEGPDFFKETTFQLEPGDRLLLYTDGVVDARNREQEEFTEYRLAEIFAAGSGMPLEDAREDIITRWREYRGTYELDDDAAFLLVEVTE